MMKREESGYLTYRNADGRIRVFSGIQPTGELHIGNYLGAISNWVNFLDENECFFCIVDHHASTIAYDPQEMPKRVFDAAVANIAAGLDPDRCTLFVQSEVPEHTELTWMFSTVTAFGDLARMTQFKQKSRQNEENVNVGLFTYPVLQAADILLYKAEAVPVGEDQVQHIEFAREVARKFNARFGECFPEPQAIVGEAKRIMGLDGQSKMSKSLKNYIGMTDPPDEIWKKLAPAVTDTDRKRRSDPGNPDICNICTLHQFFSSPDEIAHIRHGCSTAEIGCLDCKKILHENLVAALTPIQERIKELRERPDYVHVVLSDGAKRCKAMATQTMDEVRKLTGLR